MDHNEAIQLQAAVKYVLGELSQAQREEYEEHYFDCAECALDLKALATFADTAREVLRQEKATALAADRAPVRGGWLGWLRPALVPACAALLLIVTYQNTVIIPRAREEATSGAAQLFASSRAPKMAVTRGGEEVKLSGRPNESLPLKFDFTPSQTFDAYVCQLQDEAGRSLLQVRVPGSFTNKELNLVVPAGVVKPGKYALVFTGDPESKGQPTKDEVLRLSFAVEFLQ